MNVPAPKISVIVPVYNVEKFLHEALESVLAQTLREIEIICVNDGATDSSGKILRTFAARDERVRVFEKENSGYGATVNFGIAHANGKYIGILEPDDFFVPEAMQTLFDAAEKFDAEIAKGDYFLYHGNEHRRERAFALRNCPQGVPVNAVECRDLLALPLSVWSAIYRVDFLREHKILFNETPGASYQDNAFTFKVFAAAKRVVLVDAPLVNYRQDNAGSSMHARNKTFCIVDELREIERWLAENPELRERFAYEKWLFHYKAYFANLQRAPRERRREFFALFVREFREARDRGELPKALFPRLGRRLPLLLDRPEKFLRYARCRAALDAFRRAKKNVFSVKHSRDGWRIVFFGFRRHFRKSRHEKKHGND